MSDLSSSRVFVGTSGYNYPEWRGTFYPEKFSTDKMLAYYAERFPTVEINYTFYRMPTEKLLAGWAAGTPDALHVHAEGAAADHPRREAAALRGHHADVLPDRADARARSSRCCSFSCRRRSRRTSTRCGTSRRCCPRARARRSSSATRRGSTPTCSTRCARATSRSASPTARSSARRSRSTADYALLPAARRGLPAGRHRALGATSCRACRRLQDAFVYFKHEEQGLGPEFAQAADGAARRRRSSRGGSLTAPTRCRSRSRPVAVVALGAVRAGRASVTKPQWPPCSVMMTWRCGFRRRSASRNGAGRHERDRPRR